MAGPRFLVGTSGFSYDDWRGTWYPADLPRDRFLEHYAGYFNALEINATYYRVPPPTSSSRMVRHSGGRLVFAVKAPGAMTHRRECPAGLVDEFRRFLNPLAESGCLGPVLLQFPAGFRRDAAAERHLDRLVGLLGEHVLAIELRHASWDLPRPETDWQSPRICRVTVDQPDRPELSQSLVAPVNPLLAYHRFHGRNHADWYSAASNHARYRHRYSEEDVALLASHVANSGAQTTYAFFNNHPDGNAPHNAMLLARLLGVDRAPARQGDLFD